MRNCYYRESDDGRYTAVAAGRHVWCSDVQISGGGSEIFRMATNAEARRCADDYVFMEDTLPDVLAVYRRLWRITSAEREVLLRTHLAHMPAREALLFLDLLLRLHVDWIQRPERRRAADQEGGPHDG
jgi:hypothetical protein